MTPSHRSIFLPFPVNTNINNSILAIIFTIISKFIIPLKVMGFINADIPRIKNMLKRFEPTIFPIAISIFLFFAATADVASSGNDVPIDTIVKAIILSDIPMLCANFMPKTTIILPPKTNRANPNNKNIMDLDVVYSFISISSSVFSFFIS